MRNIVIAALTTIAIAGCGNGQSTFGPIASAEAAAPAFLEVGKTYEVMLTVLDSPKEATVLEIDKSSGWVKVRMHGKDLWMNFSLIPIISDIAQKKPNK